MRTTNLSQRDIFEILSPKDINQTRGGGYSSICTAGCKIGGCKAGCRSDCLAGNKSPVIR